MANRLTQREERIAQRVREAREAAGLSQEETGKALGLSVVGYGHYDRGRQPFTVEQLFQLSAVLHRSVQWFLGLETDLSEDEDRLLILYRTASPAVRDLVMATVEAMVTASER